MPLFHQAISSLGDVLQELVGETVEQVISQGRWHTSSKPRRERYSRSASRYRFGSSRRRHAGSLSRGPRAQQGLDHNDAVDRLKFNFLVRVMHRNAQSADQGMVMGPAARRSRRRNNASTREAGLYDVSGALQEVKRMQAQYRRDASGNSANAAQTARQRYQKGVEDFLYGANDHNRFFKESRLGQRYMRYADSAARRHQSNTKVLYGPSSFGQAGDNQMRLYQRRAENYRDAVQAQRQGQGRQSAMPTSTSYTWGYNTGSLAQAWGRAEKVITQLEDRFRISIGPSNQQRSPDRRPPAALLTQYLKRIIQRQGGDPNFMTPSEGQELVRESINRVQEEWAKRGIRLRR